MTPAYILFVKKITKIKQNPSSSNLEMSVRSSLIFSHAPYHRASCQVNERLDLAFIKQIRQIKQTKVHLNGLFVF